MEAIFWLQMITVKAVHTAVLPPSLIVLFIFCIPVASPKINSFQQTLWKFIKFVHLVYALCYQKASVMVPSGPSQDKSIFWLQKVSQVNNNTHALKCDCAGPYPWHPHHNDGDCEP